MCSLVRAFNGSAGLVVFRAQFRKIVAAESRGKDERLRLALLPGEPLPVGHGHRAVQDWVRARVSHAPLHGLPVWLRKGFQLHVVRRIKPCERLLATVRIRCAQIATHDAVAVQQIHREPIDVHAPGEKNGKSEQQKERAPKP